MNIYSFGKLGKEEKYIRISDVNDLICLIKNMDMNKVLLNKKLTYVDGFYDCVNKVLELFEETKSSLKNNIYYESNKYLHGRIVNEDDIPNDLIIIDEDDKNI